MNHLQACPYCPKYSEKFLAAGCTIYNDLSWVNRRGGCPNFPLRDLPEAMRKRVGQQKQKHFDRPYRSKNDGKAKYR